MAADNVYDVILDDETYEVTLEDDTYATDIYEGFVPIDGSVTYQKLADGLVSEIGRQLISVADPNVVAALLPEA